MYEILIPTGSSNTKSAYARLEKPMKLVNPRPGDFIWLDGKSAKVRAVHHRHGKNTALVLEGPFKFSALAVAFDGGAE